MKQTLQTCKMEDAMLQSLYTVNTYIFQYPVVSTSDIFTYFTHKNPSFMGYLYIYTHRMMLRVQVGPFTFDSVKSRCMSQISVPRRQATEVSWKGRGTGMSCWYLVTRFFHPNISRL